MKVAIDARAVPKSGIGNYTKVLMELLPLNGRTIEITPIYDNVVVNRNGFANKYINSFRRICFNQTRLMKLIKQEKIEILHNPKNMGIPLFSSCTIVSTIHDVIPHVYPEYYISNIIEKLYYELMIRNAISKSKIIITISEFSKKELIQYYNVSENKIRVVPLSCSDDMQAVSIETAQEILKKYGINKPFIMTIGGSEYRKNVRTVIKAYLGELEKDYDLVVIGGAWRNLNLQKEFGEHSSIKFLKGISDEDLRALYTAAEVFVFASFYEGFGLPLLEAMGCGTPVVAADASCLPEVSGDAAEYFSPLDYEELRIKIKKLLGDEALQAQMIKRGFARRKMYSWEQTVAETYKIYQELE